MATVSIVLPTYNRAHTLQQSIRSILEQTHKDFELIIVDDGSSDTTQEVLTSFSDPRIRIIRHDKNRGVAEARNTGVRAARYPYIAFQDSDDEWLPHHLEKLLQALEQSPQHTGIAYSAFYREDSHGRQKLIPGKHEQKFEGDLSSALLKNNFVTLQASLVRKECFEKTGFFDSTLKILDDWEWLIRVSEHFLFAFVGEPLTIAHYTPGNLTSQKETRMRDREILLESLEQRFRKYPSAYAKLARMIGTAKLSAGNRIVARMYLKKACQAHPLNIQTWWYIIKTFFA
jgi:glycosyltransferase involved in cell wall biosynthesis